MASSSTPPGSTALERFQAFQQTTEWRDRGDLHNLFTRYPDVNATVALNLHCFQPFMDFMATYIDKYTVPIRGQEDMWVPCDLLRYIHKDDRPFAQRLQRFCVIAGEAGQYVEDSRLVKKKIGTQFLSRLATFVFLLAEEPDRPEVTLPHMHLGGVVKDTKEPIAKPLDAISEGKILAITYPGGVMDAAMSMSDKDASDKDADASFKPQEDAAEETLTPEVFFEHLSSIVINGEEYLYLHDLEKTFDLRMDECLSILCATVASSGIDPTSDPLDRSLLPLGESMADTVELAMVAVTGAEHSSVSEEEFMATRALLEANRTPMPVHVDELENTALAPNSSISLDGKGINEEDDQKLTV